MDKADILDRLNKSFLCDYNEYVRRYGPDEELDV